MEGLPLIKQINNLGLHKDHFTGSASELKGMLYYVHQGYQVYQPLIQQSCVDFIVEKDSTFLKIQVKTARWSYSGVNNHGYLQCRTSGYTQKGQKPWDLYDVLCVVFENRLWIIPSDIIDSTNLCLDRTHINPNKSKNYKWDDYEIIKSN